MVNAQRCALRAVLVVVASAGLASAASAARFKVTFAGRDTMAWSVAAGPECTRAGSGRQTVEFAATQPVIAQIGQLRAPARGRGLVLVFRRAHEGALTVPGKATVTRVDETILSPGQCDPMPAKDCASKPLPQFFATVWGSDSGGLALHGEYWRDEPEAPFENCMAFQTPENEAGHEAPYAGWEFGDEIPRQETGDISSRPLSPARLRIGHTYKFTAHRILQLSDASLPGYVIWPNGRAGSTASELLGGDTTVTDNVSWQITLERVG
jgi:hypothetical protein